MDKLNNTIPTPPQFFSDQSEDSFLPRLLGQTLLAIRQVLEKTLGVNHITGRIMLILAHEDGITQNYLTGCIGVDASMITRTVKEMETDLGWIRRERDHTDNRLVRVFLTETGIIQANIILQQVKALNQQLTSKLSQSDLAQMKNYLYILEETARSIFENNFNEAEHK
ncbi:MAG: winged helix-turn-helix transcriptional regulator [Chloroflexi bacterium]|uniref:Winged helix-turn-helix transcriptional regulator n=1 Tax=Candidatus Chlorohelix allophototropha TaxID=3003348 RepID=A0A8T7MAA9_9CHLR|nr:winged helix-turn-helix transcriptional regulator [Chloroflexota bacterium]WJW69005.1 MarR family winged helix-turn-helix transcriptional regulator [Chloroflexota bacterium L227-S17]